MTSHLVGTNIWRATPCVACFAGGAIARCTAGSRRGVYVGICADRKVVRVSEGSSTVTTSYILLVAEGHTAAKCGLSTAMWTLPHDTAARCLPGTPLAPLAGWQLIGSAYIPHHTQGGGTCAVMALAPSAGHTGQC